MTLFPVAGSRWAKAVKHRWPVREYGRALRSAEEMFVIFAKNCPAWPSKFTFLNMLCLASGQSCHALARDRSWSSFWPQNCI